MSLTALSWQGLSSGTGLLLSSALAHFPWASSSLSALLLSLAGDQVSAGQVCRLLLSLSGFTEQLPHREMGNQVGHTHTPLSLTVSV